MKFRGLFVSFQLLVFYLIVSSSSVHALTIDFTTPVSPFINLQGSAKWDHRGGGHVWMDNFNNDDVIAFSGLDAYVNDFEINAQPWLGYNTSQPGSLPITIKAVNSGFNILWTQTIDLNPYRSWGNWLTVSVEKDHVAALVFEKTGPLRLWPSIDNLRINEPPPPPNAVPEPATMLLFGTGLVGLAGVARRKKK